MNSFGSLSPESEQGTLQFTNSNYKEMTTKDKVNYIVAGVENRLNNSGG